MLEQPDGQSIGSNRHDMLAIAGLLLLGSLAFVRLMAVPAFEDEGTQLRLIWRMIEAREWLAPLGYGKPLEAWPMVPWVRLGPQPLAMIRSLHVLVGMIGAVLTFLLARRLGNWRVAFASGALFALCPFVVYLQRLALSEIFLCVGGVWVTLCILKFTRAPTWPQATMLAIALVLAAFCKFPVGFAFLAFLPLALALMPAAQRRILLRPPALTRMVAAHAPAAVLMALVFVLAFIRLRRGQQAGFGLDDLLAVGLGQQGDIATAIGLPRPNLVTELTAQLSWPVVVIASIGLAASAFVKDWRVRWLLVAGTLPLLGIGLLPRFWYSRYLLFTLPSLIIAAVSGWSKLTSSAGRLREPVRLGLCALVLVLMGHQSARLILDPVTASWSPLDRFQYFEGWGSGYGYPEAARFIREASDAPAVIYSLDGHSAYQLRNYLPPGWNSRIAPITYGLDGVALPNEQARLDNLLRRTPAWIVVAVPLLDGYLDSSFGPKVREQVNVRQIALFGKPGSRAKLAIYEITRRVRT